MIIVIAAVIRLWQLGNVPASPDWDEAALGYNAYSILTTGRDEYGTWFPLSLRSFDDYKPGLYAYVTIPAVALFGLETWAVRLPSAIAGILAVAGTYFLVRELYKSYSIALLSALLLAISPWHIQFSRVAFEANLAVTINTWASVFFLRGGHRPGNYIVSSALFLLGLYTYHAERIFVPLYLLLLSWVWFQSLIQHRKEVFYSVCIIVIGSLPILIRLQTQGTLYRLASTSIFIRQTEVLGRVIRRQQQDISRGSVIGWAVNDRRYEWIKTVASGYLSHFSLRWLFLAGDQPRHHAPDSGLLYVWMLPFLLYGVIALFKQNKKMFMYLIGWVLIAPIAASVTFEVPHAVRTIVVLPAYQIVMAVGLNDFVKHLRRRILILVLVGIAAGGFFETLRYANLYGTHLNVEYSRFWQYGYEEAVRYTLENASFYDTIVVSTELEQPYIFFLYFSKFFPEAYLRSGGSNSRNFGKYIFRRIHWENESDDGKTLFVDTPGNMPHPNKHMVYALNGDPVIAISDRGARR